MTDQSTLQDVYTLQIRRQTPNVHNPSPYCEACKNGLVHVNSLQVRQFTQSGKLPGVCKLCNEAFLKICRLQIRHLTHSTAHAHVCPICNKSFTHAGNIKKHMLLHQKKEEVQQSNEVEDGLYQLIPPPSEINLATPKPLPPYTCPFCDRKFIKYGSYLKHHQKHSEQPLVEDVHDENETGVDTKVEEKQASETETSEKMPGAECLDVSSVTNAEVHVSAVNNVVETKTYQCDQCDKSFFKYGYLLRHFQTHEPDSFECQVCKSVFSTKPLLSSHMRTHKHVCKLCKETFTIPEELEVHLQNHMQDQTNGVPSRNVQHYCSVCQKGFVHLGYLRRHFLTHTDQNYAAEDAATTVKVKPSVKTRISIHCDICNKRFKFRRTLKKHMAVHKNEIQSQ